MFRLLCCLLLTTLVVSCAPVAQTSDTSLSYGSSATSTPVSDTDIVPGRTRPAPTLPSNAPRLRVGVFELPPYAMKVGTQEWVGISVTLFREIAQRLDMRFDLVDFTTMASAMSALSRNEIDLIAVGVDPTPDRETYVDFTHAFEQSGTSAAVRIDRSPTLTRMWEQMRASKLPRLFLGVLGFMFLIALLMSLIERRNNTQHFGDTWWKGLGESVWWSVTTMTTVGYGDRVPITGLGRVLAGIWMLLAFALMSVLAGVISSELTVNRFRPMLQNLAELPKVRCAAVADSAGAMDAEAQGLKVRTFPTLKDALTALATEQVDAVLGDTGALNYIIRDSFKNELAVLPEPLVVEYVCLSMSPKLPLSIREPLNYWLLRISESPSWQQYRRTYVGTN
ncbi:MAG: transporter substrate-binding domain-containing protein [Phycisphaerales bacterium]